MRQEEERSNKRCFSARYAHKGQRHEGAEEPHGREPASVHPPHPSPALILGTNAEQPAEGHGCQPPGHDEPTRPLGQSSPTHHAQPAFGSGDSAGTNQAEGQPGCELMACPC